MYIEDYTVNGHRVYYAVDSQGELAGLKTIMPSEDAKPKIRQLWTILDRDDPITPPAGATIIGLLMLAVGLGFPLPV